MDRRNFIKLGSSAGIAAWMGAHLDFASPINLAESPDLPRIRSLRLLTNSPLGELKKFYSGTIGFSVESETASELRLLAGATRISFILARESSRPFYHFAFNIPENKIESAFEWQKERTRIIHPNPAGTANQIVNFAHWNAHSIFFLDPAGNLVEYIARHDLKNAGTGKFSVNDILYASEIGFIVDDVVETGEAMQKAIGIKQYRPATPGFWPIGDETGLLLLIEKGKIWSGLPGQTNKTSVFKTSVSIRTDQPWQFPGYPYELLK